MAGVPVLVHTLTSLEASGVVALLVVALPAVHMEHARETLRSARSWSLPIHFVEGGAERKDSVRAGLSAVPLGVEIVLVHDGVRPLASPGLIRRVALEAARHGAAIAAVPERNTLKRVSPDGRVLQTMERSDVWEAQTPQGFRRDWLEEAHEAAASRNQQATDDAALLEAIGRPVRVVMGEPGNLKVTTPFDLALASALLNDEATRSVILDGGYSEDPQPHMQ